MRTDRPIKPLLARFAMLVLLALKGLTAHAAPALLLKPPETSSLSVFERTVFEVFLIESIRSVDTYELILETTRETSIKKLEENLASGSASDSAPESSTARFIVLASAGKSGMSYNLTLKLLDAPTGETVATATERFPTFPQLLENGSALIHATFAKHEPAPSAPEQTMSEKAGLDFSRKIVGVSQKRFVQWAKASLRIDADIKKPTEELADALDQYIAEYLPPGIGIYYGGYGTPPLQYISTRVYTDPANIANNDIDYTDISYIEGLSGGFAGGIHYRFNRFPYLATGLWVSLGSHVIRYYIETYENSILKNTGRINYDAHIDISALPFVEIPIRLDSIAVLAGTGWYLANYHSGLEAALGLRAGKLVFRYGLRIRETALETWPSSLSLMYTSALGER